MSLEAAQQGNCRKLKEMIDEGGESKNNVLYNTKDNKDNNALHIAARNGHIECVRILIDAGADKNIQNKNGATPLMNAVLYEHIDIVRFLIEAGANLNIKNTNDQQTALEMAVDYGYTDIVDLLKSKTTTTSGGRKRKSLRKINRKKRKTKRKTKTHKH